MIRYYINWAKQWVERWTKRWVERWAKRWDKQCDLIAGSDWSDILLCKMS